MNVTLMTDASICQDYKIGAYGFWIASDRGKQSGNGVFLESTEDSNIGEMRAVVYSLATAINSGLIQQFDQVLIQVDNTNAIRFLEGNFSTSYRKQGKTRLVDTQEFKKIIENFNALKKAYFLMINFRHVKGHSRNTSSRFASNNYCDIQAKIALRKARHFRKIKIKKGISK